MPTKNLVAHAVHNKVYRAIRSGKLDPPYYMTCRKCGVSPCEYHHPNYKRPLKVVPLCRWCHRRVHKKKRRRI